jgi:serine/threonine-protein kinase
VALHALAAMRAWFARTEPERDWATVARNSLERAMRLAPDLAETLLARAMVSTQEGEWRTAVLSLRAALDAAPTCAAALHYLGNLQCEAGRADEGLERLRLAYTLEPALSIALLEFCRCSALRGKMEDFQWASERLMAQPALRVPALLLRLRVFAWTGQLDEVRRCRDLLREEPSPMAGFAATQYAVSVLGEVEPLVALKPLDEMLNGGVSPRFASMLCQLATEQLALRGLPERALEYFQRAADTALIDLEWIDRCQALTSLRALPGFVEGRRKVRARVEAIWTA